MAVTVILKSWGVKVEPEEKRFNIPPLEGEGGEEVEVFLEKKSIFQSLTQKVGGFADMVCWGGRGGRGGGTADKGV